MNEQASQRALKIWQLCTNCRFLEDDLPECPHIRAVEWSCERYECTALGIETEMQSAVNDDTVSINHVQDELERPASDLLQGHTREQLIDVVMKVIKFAG